MTKSQTLALTTIHPILADRGIAPDWAQRYVRYEKGEWDAFQAADHTHCDRWMRRAFVDACGGFVIHRWDAAGQRLPSYVRPDKAVCTMHGRESVKLGTRPTCGRCGKRLSKYTQSSKRATGRSGKLIDVHPSLVERLQGREEPIYLCLEGCLKADAVASTGRLAISVPSVTLWRADEEESHWALWAPLLRGAPVVHVVPDSDYQPRPGWSGYEPGHLPRYAEGGEVRYSTDRCVHWLRRYQDVNARFAVPPYLSRQEAHAHQVADRFKVGIDDHLALGGNLEPWDRELNPRGIHMWVYERADFRLLPPRTDVQDSARLRERDRRFLSWLECFAGAAGYYSPADVQRDLGWSRSTVLNAKQSCMARGALRVDDGHPRGEGNGNDPHLYRFMLSA